MKNICTVIPSFNNAGLVSTLLEQLRRLPEFNRISVTVVDNGSSDGTSERIEKQFPFVELIRLSENRGGSGGFIAGVNHVMKKNPDYIWMLDDDAEINEQTLSELLKAVEDLDRSGTRWGAVGSMMANLNDPENVTETGAALDWRACRFRPCDSARPITRIKAEVKAVEYCAAASLLTRPAVVKQVGFFEDVFIHYDDVDWCLRLRKAGLPVYCATASIIWHPSRKNAPVTWVRYYDARNFIWLCRRHNRKWTLWAVAHMLIKSIYFYLHRMRDISRLYFQGVCDAFSGTLRMRSDLALAPQVSLDAVAPPAEKHQAAGVFLSRSQYNELIEMAPELAGLLNPLFFYEPEEREIHGEKVSRFRKLSGFLRSALFMLLHPGTPVVFDGECMHHIMFPALLNKTCYVFPGYQCAMLKGWSTK